MHEIIASQDKETNFSKVNLRKIRKKKQNDRNGE
jgi:hypothetical protein